MTEHHDDDFEAKLLASHRENIARDGYSIQGVLPDEDQPTYTYTIGLTETYGHPEIFLVGLRPDDAAGILVSAIERIRNGERFDKPVFAGSIIVGYEVPFRPISSKSVIEHGNAGLAVLGPFDAVQMFYPDRGGYVPWEGECDARFKSQLFFELTGDEPRRNLSIEAAAAAAPPRSPLTPEQIAENRRRITTEMRRNVAENGFVPQVVAPSETQPGFLYTIGLTETWSHPEIYVVGLSPNQAFDIVLDLIDRITEGERFDTPTFVDEILDVPIAVRPLEQASVDENSGIAQDVLGRTITAVQVYWPDASGLLPWEAGCDEEIVRCQLSLLDPRGEEPLRLKSPPGVGLH